MSLDRITRRTISLKSGTLQIAATCDEPEFDKLCGFGSRRWGHRGFVIVSKVLGKHYPVRPRDFQDICNRLSNLIISPESPITFIGLAETAIGLGHGVFESWLLKNPAADAIYIHGTRYRLNSSDAIVFDEPHSHAPTQWLHLPVSLRERMIFETTRTLVLIDDELTTGTTVANLISVAQNVMPRLERVIVVSLTSWISPERKAELEKRPAKIDLATLIAGTLDFRPHPEFKFTESHSSVGTHSDKQFCLPHNFGRLGITSKIAWPEIPSKLQLVVSPEDPILVLGTGECHFPAFKIAEFLEKEGRDVIFQSTTRSPLMIDGEIKSALEFVDNYHDGIPNFLYNVDRLKYNQILVCYETYPIPSEHRLLEILNASPVFLGK